MLILLPRPLLLPYEVRLLHRRPHSIRGARAACYSLRIQKPRAPRCPLSIQVPTEARCPRVERFFPGSWRPLSQCLSLVTPSQTHAVGLVCILWPPPPRLRYQVQTKYPQLFMWWRRAVSREFPSVPAA